MDNFDLKAFLTENKLTTNSKMLSEIKVNNPNPTTEEKLSKLSKIWNSFGDDFEYYDEDEVFYTGGILFSPLDDEEKGEEKEALLSAEIQFNDFGDNGKEIVDELWDDLYKRLDKHGYELYRTEYSRYIIAYIKKKGYNKIDNKIENEIETIPPINKLEKGNGVDEDGKIKTVIDNDLMLDGGDALYLIFKVGNRYYHINYYSNNDEGFMVLHTDSYSINNINQLTSFLKSKNIPFNIESNDQLWEIYIPNASKYFHIPKYDLNEIKVNRPNIIKLTHWDKEDNAFKWDFDDGTGEYAIILIDGNDGEVIFDSHKKWVNLLKSKGMKFIEDDNKITILNWKHHFKLPEPEDPY